MFRHRTIKIAPSAADEISMISSARNRVSVPSIATLALTGWLAFASSPAVLEGTCPSAAVGDVMRDPVVRGALDDAWRDSLEGTPREREEGGFVLQCQGGPGGYTTRVQRWPSGSTAHGNVLRGPEPPEGCRAVAFFHTHPGGAGTGSHDDGFDNDHPSDDDNRFASRYGIPGIIRYGEGSDPANTHDFAYGPPEPRIPQWRCPVPPVGVIHGDPHLRTFDGASFDFQVEGDFVLVESGDDLMVQVRLEPIMARKVSGARILTQARSVAVRIGGSTVELGVDGIWIDGVARDAGALSTWTAPDGAASLIDDVGAVQLTWPDGSRLVLNGPIAVAMRLADVRAATARGLLGNDDGDATNDLVAADGTDAAEGGLLHDDRLAGAFADGNRVADGASLFHGPAPVDAGSSEPSTAAADARPATLTDLADSVRAEATRSCAAGGVTDPALLLDCTLDVGASGDVRFITGALRTQQAQHALGLGGAAFSSSEVELLAAVTDGDTARVLAVLVGDKPDPDVRRVADGATPLMIASQLGDSDMVGALLEAGADPSARDGAGTPVLVFAAGRGDADVVRLLMTAGADSSVPDPTGWTALHAAAFNGHDTVVTLLLGSGASVAVEDDRGLSPLVAAAQVGHASTAGLLLDAGAEVDQATRTGATALMWAATNGHADTVRLLLGHGADPTLKATDGSTALDLAVVAGHHDVIELLS